jgi:hypothetical protein
MGVPLQAEEEHPGVFSHTVLWPYTGFKEGASERTRDAGNGRARDVAGMEKPDGSFDGSQPESDAEEEEPHLVFCDGEHFLEREAAGIVRLCTDSKSPTRAWCFQRMSAGELGVAELGEAGETVVAIFHCLSPGMPCGFFRCTQPSEVLLIRGVCTA